MSEIDYSMLCVLCDVMLCSLRVPGLVSYGKYLGLESGRYLAQEAACRKEGSQDITIPM